MNRKRLPFAWFRDRRKAMGGYVALAFVILAIAGCGVHKNPPSSPGIKISADPASIHLGQSTTLTITAVNASSVTVTGSDGTSYTLGPSGGTENVSPQANTTYTATATGLGGTATATVSVAVGAPLPTVTIQVSPTTISEGGSANLEVSATKASSVVVTGTDGSSYTLSATGGTQKVTPDSSTTYTATATGAGGKVTAQVSLNVIPAPLPTVTIAADPASIFPTQSSTLTVVATNDETVMITGSDGSSYTLVPSGGIQSVSPSATTTYTATVTGLGGTASAQVTVTVTAAPTPTVSIEANPKTIATGNSSLLSVTASNASQVTITGSDGSSYTLTSAGGSQAVSPTADTTYTVQASGYGQNVNATATVSVVPQGTVDSIDHVVFMLQENHTFDNYFGMLNPYRVQHGWNIGTDGKEYDVDGIADKLNTISNPIDLADGGGSYKLFKFTSTCIDDMSSDWLASFGDVNRFDFSEGRQILMDGFVHTAAGFDKFCAQSGICSGDFTDPTGMRAMGYYDQDFLNYYYYMASQFALSDRWFSPVATKSIGNRIATFTGGTTQGLVKDPGNDDHLPQLNINNIFEELDQAGVSWKIYYTTTDGFCLDVDDCPGTGNEDYPASDFENLTYSYRYLYQNPSGAPCTPPTQPSSVVGDTSNSFCIDVNHIAPLSDYYKDLTNGTLPSFVFIEAGYGNNDEHPGSGQSILEGQAEVAKIINALMASPEWKDSVFFLSYDEGGGPYDHVPPVPGHSNDNTDPAVVSEYPDISSIAVNPDGYGPCVPEDGVPTTHCDLKPTDPGANPTDAAAVQGFAAQLGFRLPNMVVSPFSRKHFVSHIPMDHTAVIKFVESRFIGPDAHLTARDAAQPNLLDFFDFEAPPWETPPTPPAPVTPQSLGYNPCTPQNFGVQP